jgi:hypothetical protein
MGKTSGGGPASSKNASVNIVPSSETWPSIPSVSSPLSDTVPLYVVPRYVKKTVSPRCSTSTKSVPVSSRSIQVPVMFETAAPAGTAKSVTPTSQARMTNERVP